MKAILIVFMTLRFPVAPPLRAAAALPLWTWFVPNPRGAIGNVDPRPSLR